MLAHHPKSTAVLLIGLVAMIFLNATWFFSYDDQINSAVHACINKLEDSSPQHQILHNVPDAAYHELDELETTGLGYGDPKLKPGSHKIQVDWSHFAYLQYVTAAEHACNSVMVFEALHRLGSKAQRVLLYPQAWGDTNSVYWGTSPGLDHETSKLLLKARDEYHVMLKPVDVIRKKGQESTWEAGFTKLLAFNETSFARTIMFDSDATVLKHLDHLFLLPPTPLAIPRAYWLSPNPPPEKTINKYKLSAQLLVATPDRVTFNKLIDEVNKKGEDDYDMEIINWVLGPVAMVLPHRGLNLLSGEFRQEHSLGYDGYDRYLGLGGETWDAKKVLDEAYYIHFSDFPRPKPWYLPNQENLPTLTPKCYPKALVTPIPVQYRQGRRTEQDMDCSDREAWLWLYEDFKTRRKSICGLDLFDAPPLPA